MDIEVDEATLVDVGETFGDFLERADEFLRAKREIVHAFLQARAAEPFEDGPEGSLFLDEGFDFYDVRVFEEGKESRLAAEGDLLVLGFAEFGTEGLGGDVTTAAGVPAAVDVAEGAASDRGVEVDLHTSTDAEDRGSGFAAGGGGSVGHQSLGMGWERRAVMGTLYHPYGAVLGALAGHGGYAGKRRECLDGEPWRA